jgi:uncharacterized membrane protein
MFKKILLSSCLIFIFPFIALAENSEIIENFETEIKINQDATVDIVENIEYNFGSQQKHGIIRTLPIKYKARGGKYSVDISEIKVYLNGQKYDHFTTKHSGENLKIKIGEADKLITGQQIYTIQYTTNEVINFFDEYDEFYWNVNGTEWSVPIQKTSAKVFFPPTSQSIKLACYFGAYGSEEQCSAEQIDNQSVLFSTQNLQVGENMSIILGLPKNLIDKPTATASMMKKILDNLILLLPITTLIFLLYLWLTRGRDAVFYQTIIPQYAPPKNLTPLEVGVVIDEKADNRDISAEIIQLAIKGFLKIQKINPEKKSWLGNTSNDYVLIKLKNAEDTSNKIDKLLMVGIFGHLNKVKVSDLKNNFYQDLQKIKTELYKSVEKNEFFLKNPNTIRKFYRGLGSFVMFTGFFIGSFLESGIAGASIIFSGALFLIFSFAMPALTQKGVEMKAYILGLKMYLEVAEKDRINFHNAPEKNPKHFEELLSYAMVLKVETEWAKQFENIYQGQPDWYEDSFGGTFNPIFFTQDLHSFSQLANSSLASRPNTAASGGSGFSSGGGFSGGGFGGGGGSSW